MNVLKKVLVLVVVAVTFSCQRVKEATVFTENNIAVIPKPAHLKLNAGSFQFSKNQIRANPPIHNTEKINPRHPRSLYLTPQQRAPCKSAPSSPPL